MLSRRQLLHNLALLTAGVTCAPLFTACSNNEQTIASGLPEPYATWTALQALLRASSDHLPGRLAATVPKKDWKAAYHIVRNNFTTLPGKKPETPFGAGNNDLRAGPYACERAGAGTILEQCLVLQRYLAQMGLIAELYSSPHTLDEATYLAQLTRNAPPEFDAILSGVLAENTKNAGTFLGPDGVADGPREEVFTAAKQTEHQPFYSGMRSAKYVPVILLTTATGDRYVLPLFGKEKEPRPLTDATGYRPVTTPPVGGQVQLILGAKFRGMLREQTLLEHKFPVSEVAGRHVNVVFDNGVPLDMAGEVALGALTTFTPAFHVPRQPQDPLSSTETPAVVGDGFTVFGDKITLENDAPQMNGVPLLIGPAQPDLSARVTTVEVRAVGYNAPVVLLDLWARDADGNPVEGLFPDDLTVMENGHRFHPQLFQNVIKPRIVILYDTTKSVPAKFLDKAYIKAFEQQMRADILKLHPNATVELKLTRDQYYDHLAKEVLDPPDLIICQSDGLIIGDPQPRHKAMLAKLPPVIFAHVVEDVHPDLVTLAEFIEVTPIYADNKEALLAEVRSKLDARTLPPYRMQYIGNPVEDGLTPVSVMINGRTGESSYESEVIGSAPVIESLHLTVRFGRTAGKFVLGGWDSRLSRSPAVPHADEALAALHTGASVYIEGAGPTTSVMLDDLLTGRLSTLPVMQAESGDTLDGLKEAMGKTIVNEATPLSLLQQFPGTVGNDHLTFPEGLRVCIYQNKVDFTSGGIVTRSSILPTSAWRTEGLDPAANFRRTFDHTWELARAEAALHQQSTISLLRGRPLAKMDEIDQAQRDKSLDWDREEYYELARRVKGYQSNYSSTAVVAEDAALAAHFYIYNLTGEVIGVLPDLTGGGRSNEAIKLKYKKIDTALSVFITAASNAKLIPMGAFFALIGKLYIIASTHLATLDATMDSRCEMMKAIKGAMIDAVVGKMLAVYVPRAAAAQGALAGNGVNEANASTHLLGKCSGF